MSSFDQQVPPTNYEPRRAPPLAKGIASQPVYPDEAPHAQPSNKPIERPDTPLAHLDTDYLNRVQKDLRNHIPSDPTFMAHVGAILRAIIQFDLSHPGRIAADKAVAEQQAADAAQKADADLAARHEAEKADPTLTEAEAAALAQRHEQELAVLEHQRKADALADRQAADRRKFERIQQEQRDALVAS